MVLVLCVTTTLSCSRSAVCETKLDTSPPPPIHPEGHMTSSKRMGHPTDDLQKLKGSLSTLRLQDTDAYSELCEKMRDESNDPTLSVSSIISPPSR